jgi:hypothetical protein
VEILGTVDILMERPLDKHRLCLVRSTGRWVNLELWYKTRRRKSPWDRCLVANMDGAEAGLTITNHVNDQAVPFLDRIRDMLPEFSLMAVVETVSLR